MKATQLIGGVSPKLTTQTASFTIGIDDAGSYIRASHATVPITVTVPLNATVAFAVGTTIEIEQAGVVAVTVAGDVGVTVNVVTTKTLVSAARYGVAKLIKVGTNEWTITGDLAA